MQTLVGFQESNFSPWGRRPRSAHKSPLPDASQKYTFCVGSISTVNQILAKKGLHYPPEIPLLANKPRTASVTSDSLLYLSTSCEDLLEYDMANKHRRGKKPLHTRKPSEPPSDRPVPEPTLVKKEMRVSLRTPDDLPPPSEEAKLVELASFSGFDPHHSTSLPHGLDPLEQMQRTSRAQTMLSGKREGFKETWKILFYKPASQTIFQDYFWWFFLHKYKNFQFLSVQTQLFNRISANYVSLLCEDVDLRWRDSFFKVYPDVMAQCVYSAFLHAYPASWSSFDDSFKSELIKIISLWQVGTRPLSTTWKKWNFSVLEPPNHLKHLSKEMSEESSVHVGSTKTSKKKASFDLDALLKEYEERERASSLLPREEALVSEDRAPVHISVSNFEEELASSLATEKIRISTSKEELVKTQAQATRELLSKNTRPAEQSQAGSSQGTKLSANASKKPSAVSENQMQSQTKTHPISKSGGTRSPSKKPTSGVSLQPPKSVPPRKGSQAPSPVKAARAKPSVQAPRQPQLSSPQTRAIHPSSSVRDTESVSPSQRTHAGPGHSVNTQRAGKPNSPAGPTSKPQEQQRTAPLSTKAPQRVHQASSLHPSQNIAPPMSSQASGQSPQKPQAQPRSNPPQQGKPLQTGAQRAAPTADQADDKTTSDSRRKSVWKDKAMEIIKREAEQAPVSIRPAVFEHVLYDIYGHSPLVRHFLKERSLSRENETKVLMGRTELIEEEELDFVSYNDIIAEAIETGIRNHTEFNRLYLEQKSSMAKSQAARKKASQQHEQDVKQLLGMKSEVRGLSNEIATHIMSQHFTGLPVSKEAMATVIEKALNRLKQSSPKR